MPVDRTARRALVLHRHVFLLLAVMGGAACSSDGGAAPEDAASPLDAPTVMDVQPDAPSDDTADAPPRLDAPVARDVPVVDAPVVDAPVVDVPVVDVPVVDVPVVDAPVVDAPVVDVPVVDVPIATATNADCAMATRLPGTSRLAGEDLSLARGAPSTANCGSGDRLFYAVTVPPASSILVTVTPRGAPGWDPYVRVLDACMDSFPLCSRVAAYAGVGAPEVLRYVNAYSSGTTGMPVAHDVIVVVGASGGATGRFDLDVQVAPPDANATCAGALPLPTDGSSINADLRHGGSTGFLCLGGLTGAPTLYYQATVPPGSELTATMTPTGAPPFGVELFSYTTCPSTCAARVDTGAEGAAEALVVPNNGTTPQTIAIGASADTSSPLGTFSLTGLVAPQFYVTSSLSAACDAVPSVGHFTSPNRVTAAQALPFPFTLFGEAVAGYGLSSNGFMQLLPGATGAVSATPINRALPLTETPNGIVAPFWDALATRPTFGSDLRAGVLGTAPNRRFVVEWADWGLVEDPTARLRFQAKLFEGSQVIEMHYCSLAMGTMTDLQTGRHATIGVENLAGTRAVLVGANNRRVVASGSAIRLTPR
jgi:hypothetical protein